MELHYSFKIGEEPEKIKKTLRYAKSFQETIQPIISAKE